MENNQEYDRRQDLTTGSVLRTGQLGKVIESSPGTVTNGYLKRYISNRAVDVEIWLNKDVNNQSICVYL